MPQLITCPTEDELRPLLQGKAPAEALDAFAEHLAQCRRCADSVDRLLTNDPLLDTMRGQGTISEPIDPSAQNLMEQLSRLGPAEATAALPPPSPEATAEVGAGKPAAAERFPFLAPPQATDEIGRLGSYRVLQVLGSGGMGVVFRAEDVNLQRQVALKVMKPDAAERPGAKDRFLREARAAASLEHEHVVAIYQVGEERGVPYLAMQWLKGMRLEDRLHKTGALTVPQVLRLGRQIAVGLAAAHEHGLIHRDIKPGNLWLEPEHGGRIRILDFGLARSLADEAHLTQSGFILGTPAYMAPEQARSETVDHRCDLFSLGVVLYRLCTGEMPFRGDNTMAVLTALALETPPAPRTVNAAVPEELSALIEELLAKDPALRPASARAVAERLGQIERRLAAWAPALDPTEALPQTAGINPAARTTQPGPQPAAAGRKRRALAAVAVAGLVLFDRNTQVTDAGLKELAGLKGLNHLQLRGTNVSDAGLVDLVEMRNLAKLDLLGARVSRKGFATLKATLPEAEFTWSEPNRTAAEAVLALGGSVHIAARGQADDRLVEAAADLPADYFQVTRVNLGDHLRKQRRDIDGVPAKLAALRDPQWDRLEVLLLSHTTLGDGDLAQLQPLKGLRRLVLDGTAVTNTGLAHLKGMSALTDLSLARTQISDDGLEQLKPLRGLKRLALDRCPISGPGLTHLSNLRKLERLSLALSGVRNASLKYLHDLTDLKELDLSNTKVNAEGVAELQKALPQCKIASGWAAKRAEP